MTNQSIWAGNSPRLCLLLGTFHTVTLQSDLVLCLLYIGKGIFSLELAQGTVWNRGKVYIPIFNKLYTYQKGITGYEVYLNRIPTSLTTLKDKGFIALLANKYPWYFLLQKAEHTVKKILTQKKKPKKGGKVCKFLKDYFFFEKVFIWIKLPGNFISISATHCLLPHHTLPTSQENKENSHFHVVVRKMQILLVCGGETRKRKCQQPSALAKSTSEAAEQLPSYPGNRVYPSADGKIACNYHPGVKHQFGQNINFCLLQLL